MIPLVAIRAAASRIAPHVRRTPLLPAMAVREPPGAGIALTLKLECLQVTGSFKARGAINAALGLPPATLARGVITASGGNHGLAVAYAASVAGVPGTVVLPRSVPAAKIAKLRAWGAEVVVAGEVWDDANDTALELAAARGLAYLHPFADPAVLAGQGTVGTEILDDDPDTDMVIVAIGGGGLIGGVASAARALKPSLRVIGVEPTGAPTLRRSVEAGAVVTLDRVDTRAVTLAPRRSDPLNLAIVQQAVSEIVLVTDAEMDRAARWLWFEFAIAAELSGAAAIAALLSGKLRPAAGTRVCAIVCGAGTDGTA